MNEQSIFLEQETVQKYCIEREIRRPATNLWTAAKLLFLLEVCTLTLSGMAICFSELMGYTISFSLSHLVAGLVIIILNLKRIFILSVKLYQHYAPEQTRRKCTLHPSCSDYSILALNKYGLFKALYKIYIRLFHTCKGVYQIDYP
jgi:putative component of membrane protein insertase Oxa1/YidC/SpoIIIJ protein YidD